MIALFFKTLTVLVGLAYFAWTRNVLPKSLREWRERRSLRLTMGRKNMEEVVAKLRHAFERGGSSPMYAKTELARAERCLHDYGLQHDKQALAMMRQARLWVRRIAFREAGDVRERVLAGEAASTARALTMPPPPAKRAVPMDAQGRHINMDLDAPFTLGLTASIRRAS